MENFQPEDLYPMGNNVNNYKYGLQNSWEGVEDFVSRYNH